MTNFDIDRLNSDAWEQRELDLQYSYKNGLELLTLSEARDYDRGIADASKTLGYCFWRFSNFSLSLHHSLKALKIYKSSGDLKSEADTLNNIGAVYMFQNDNVKRLDVNLKCKEIRQQAGDLEGVTSSEGNIGETYFEMGDYSNALLRFESVLVDKNSSIQGLAWAHHNIGRVNKVKCDLSKALTSFKKGLTLSLSVKYNVLVVDSYLAITELFLVQKKFVKAIVNANLALDVSRKIGAKDGEKNALYFLSKIFEIQGHFKESLQYHKAYHVVDMEISSDSEIERLKTTQLKVVFEKVEEQKNELIASIKYAEQIQTAVLTSDQNQKLLKDFTVFYQPKDIVSGDFYWYHEKGDHFYLCVADCTGHGVPGAFLTMLGTTFLNVIIATDETISPAEILDQLRLRIINALSQKNGQSNKDGMDISMIRVNTKTNKAEWAGAFNPLLILRNSKGPVLKTNSVFKHLIRDDYQLYEIKADKEPISISEKMSPFTNHKIQLKTGDAIYLFSDGYSDQFGGAFGKKFMSLNFKKLLLKIQNQSMAEQGDVIKSSFQNWKGQIEQVDDVCVLGFKM